MSSDFVMYDSAEYLIKRLYEQGDLAPDGSNREYIIRASKASRAG